MIKFDYFKTPEKILWHWAMYINEDLVGQSTNIILSEEACKNQILAIVRLIAGQDPIYVTNRDTGEETVITDQ